MKDAALVVRKKENEALLAQFLDSKPTRNELIDLVLDGVRAEIQAEIDVAEAEAKKWPAPELTLDEAMVMAKAGLKSIEIWDEEIRIKAKKQKMPERYTEAKKKHDAASKKCQAVRQKMYCLDSGRARARMEMVRAALTMAPEGERVLEAIDDLGQVVKARLEESIKRDE